ncbi:MAG: tetratricopeptide repeat protein [Myxococcaceae bacterium]|nr:tetratricopeptide repeat protein [Myxococcaceae bacterium]MCA3016893.1 tetratricopeptide repeat protein [Myxococcaceae bacterium]
MELDRIQKKVEAGARLDATEFATLERAAREEGGPALRTAVAQALINADEVIEAVRVLETVRRDFPTNLHVLLAFGRAAASLERWSDAERALRQALELQPEDPEVLTALALVALRQGARSRARALIDDVLSRDPFHGEAQLIAAELKEGGAPFELKASRDDFVSALLDQLKRQSTPHLLQKQQLLVRLSRKGIARLDVDALYQDFLDSGRALSEGVRFVTKEIAERALAMPGGKLQFLSRVLPVLRDSSFLERAEGTVRREGPAGLWVFYAVEDPEAVLYVPQGLLDAHRVTAEQLDAVAWKNLDARPAEVRAIALEQGALRLSTTPTGLWCIAHGDGHDGARLLTASHQAAMERTVGPGPFRVYLGLRELVLFCRLSDPLNAAKLEGLDAARDGIAGGWRLEGDKLLRLDDWAGL